MSDPEVSVICNTYNHGKYIRESLEGFLMQRTDFAFEVLVHDDASTDDTADIIRGFQADYPEIVKPIFQTENQYSKGGGINKRFQFPRAKGQYIAYCEGDDYWTDPEKLQKQYDALEAHPEVDMCGHTTSKRYSNGKEVIVSVSDTISLITPEQMILGGGLSLNTCSLMYRATMLNEKWNFREYMDYDYTLKIQGSLRGGILYLPDNMATYRFMSGPDSWTSRVLRNNDLEINHTKKRLQMLDYLNEDTELRYSEKIEERKRQLGFDLLWYENQYRDLLRPEFSDLFRKLSVKKQAVIRFGTVFPGITRTIRYQLVNRFLKGKTF